MMRMVSARRWILAALVAAGGGFAGPARGGSITLVPTSAGVSNVDGNTTTSAPGFGTSSFQGNGVSKAEIYIATSQLFTGSVSISDIASVTYWTNKGTPATAPDWTFLMYTNTTGTGDEAGWYHTRLNAEPYFTNSTVTPNTWHQWSTGGTNPLLFYDQGRSGTYGTYTDPTLAQLQAGPVTWNGTGPTVDYRTETIKYFSLQTGSAWANGFNGLVDGLAITLKDGQVGSVNLEAAQAVPEPATLALLASALPVGLAALRRRRAGA